MVKLKRSDLEIWDKVDPIKLIDSAQLWLGNCPSPTWWYRGESAYGKAQALISELRRLKLCEAGGEPNMEYEVSRANYMLVAETWGEKPPFLYPDTRRRKTGQKQSTVKLRKECYYGIKHLIEEEGMTTADAARRLTSKLKIDSATIERNYRRHRSLLAEDT